VYDGLNRLTSASTTAASSSPFKVTYAYDALGNLSSKSDNGTYTYAGTGYANPDAVTQIAIGLSTSTFSYDNNGNLAQKTTDGVTHDVRLRLRQPSNCPGLARRHHHLRL